MLIIKTRETETIIEFTEYKLITESHCSCFSHKYFYLWAAISLHFIIRSTIYLKKKNGKKIENFQYGFQIYCLCK